MPAPASPFLSYGFRPFFLAGALQAAAAVGLWLPAYLGLVTTPGSLPPLAWHGHELLFGYIPAIVSGFLLTAVASWTGRQPVAGPLLATLVALWLAGRIAVAVAPAGFSLALPALAFPTALLAVVGREVIAGRSWRNLKVLAALGTLLAAQALFYVEIANAGGTTTYAAHLAVAATVALIVIIGGRIVPNFTANWLRQYRPGPLPPGLGGFDRASASLVVAALTGWVALPALPPRPALAVGALLGLAGASELARQWRWQPLRTLGEPLVTVLHAGYACVPLGLVLAAGTVFAPGVVPATAATHAWTVGAVGLMTLAVMTRASRGHTGRPLTAPAATVAIYAGILVAVAARLAAALLPDLAMPALGIAAGAWVLAFGGFAVAYGPMLLGPRLKGG
jgi:uncharacterized protein involved in response to NO